MRLYIKQKVFSFRDRFSVYDETGREVYHAFGEIMTFGHKLHITDLRDNEVAYVHQQLLSFLPRYFISRNGDDVAEVVKHFSFLHQSYTVDGFGWNVEGDFFAHEFSAEKDGRTVFTVSKQWLTWGDTYEIHVADGVDAVNALAVVLIIDNCMQRQNSSN